MINESWTGNSRNRSKRAVDLQTKRLSGLVACTQAYPAGEVMDNGKTIKVEVAYALPHRQALIALQLPPGTTAMEAAQQSGIAGQFDDMDLDNATLGIFGNIVAPEYELRDGDRVEIYRPLTADPKAVRKARAERLSARRKGK